MNRQSALTLVVLAAVVATVGCDLNRQPGDRGRLVFEYYSDKDARNFDKPIIEGGHLRIYVYDIFERRRTEILEARSRNQEVARVEGTVDHLFVIEGVAPGRTSFEVRARDADGEVRRDTVSLRVDRPRSVHFHPTDADAFSGQIVRARDPIVGGKSLTVTAGSRIRIPWTREAVDGDPMVGYGAYPIAVEPAGAARLHDRRIQDDDFTLVAPEEPRTFEVVPADGLGGEPLAVETVAPEADRMKERRSAVDSSRAIPQATERGCRRVATGADVPITDVPPRDDGGWGRWLLKAVLVLVAVWLALALAACLLLIWICRAPGD